MAPAPEENALPPSLRFLKALVIVLMLCMILGVITVTALLVTRLRAPLAPTLPEAVQLPAGEAASAVTFGRSWTAVVTESGRILIFNPDGSLRQEIDVLPAP